MPVISGLKTNAVTIGTSNTDTNNFQLRSNADGTATLARKSDGSGGDVLTVDGSGIVAMPSGSKNLTLMTAQATTSGTSIDFTGIPSWAKRITVMFNGVSTNGTSPPQIQLGAGSIDSTGYSSSQGGIINSGVLGTLASVTTTGILISNNMAIADTLGGSLVISLMGSNIWTASGITNKANTAYVGICGGNKTLSGVLDRVRITTLNGTDTFDAGSVNILYEG